MTEHHNDENTGDRFTTAMREPLPSHGWLPWSEFCQQF